MSTKHFYLLDEAMNRVLLPDVCTHFKVTYKDAFFMLKDLAIRFEWRGIS